MEINVWQAVLSDKDKVDPAKLHQNVQKFIDLLKTDGSLQEKVSTAVNNYTGEQTPEAAFQNVVLPIAEEAGCHFTWEDYQKYLQEETKNLDLDEMDQVAGGGETKGTALSACIGIGMGGGATVKMKDDGSGYSLSTICLFVGFGESSACAYNGASTDYNKDLNHEWTDCSSSGG